MLNLNKIERKINNLLIKETNKSLLNWLKNKRNNSRLKNEIF